MSPAQGPLYDARNGRPRGERQWTRETFACLELRVVWSHEINTNLKMCIVFARFNWSIDVSFSFVCPVIDHEVHHNFVKVRNSSDKLTELAHFFIKTWRFVCYSTYIFKSNCSNLRQLFIYKRIGQKKYRHGNKTVWSLDVSSLFTNVQHEETLNICLDKLYSLADLRLYPGLFYAI